MGQFNSIHGSCRDSCNELRRNGTTNLGLSLQEKWIRKPGRTAKVISHTLFKVNFLEIREISAMLLGDNSGRDRFGGMNSAR